MSDHGHYTNVHVDVDSALAEEFPNGIRRQEISIVMTDESGAPIWRHSPRRFATSKRPARGSSRSSRRWQPRSPSSGSRHDERPGTLTATVARRSRRAAAATAAALYPRGRTARDRDRSLATMGARGRPAGPARRGGPPAATKRRSSRAAKRPATHGQDTRRMGGSPLTDPQANPASATNTRVGRPRGEPLRLRPIRDREGSTGLEALGTTRSTKATPWSGSPWRASPGHDTAPMTAPRRRSESSPGRSSSSSTTSASYLFSPTPPRRCSGSSTRPTRNARSRSPNIHPAGFDELMPNTRRCDRRPTTTPRARAHHRRR